MKQVIICGDSFMSPVLTYPGTHFSQIFCREMGYDLLCFSRSGMSNAGIMVQINTAIERKPDLIIFNTSGFDRIELPVKYCDLLAHKDYNEFFVKFKPYTTDNLLYTQSVGLSTHYPWANKDPKILSMSISDLLHPTMYDSRKDTHYNHNAMKNLEMVEDYEEKMKAVKIWFKYLYDERIKKMADCFMMYGVITKLHNSGIDYIWAHDSLFDGELINMDWVPKKNNIKNIIGSKIAADPKPKEFKDPGYHTTFETQEACAQILIDHYKINFLHNT